MLDKVVWMGEITHLVLHKTFSITTLLKPIFYSCWLQILQTLPPLVSIVLLSLLFILHHPKVAQFMPIYSSVSLRLHLPFFH